MPSGVPLLGVDTSAVSTTPEFKLGSRAFVDSGEFLYVQADGDLSAKEACKITGLGTFQAAPSGNAGRADAVANVLIPDNSYGWVQTKGYVANAVVATSVDVDEFLAIVVDASGDFIAVHATGAAAGDTHIRAVALETDTAGVADIWLY